MAIGSIISANTSIQPSTPVSGRGVVVTINDDAVVATTQVANPYNALAITDANFHWCKLGPDTSMLLLRARITAAASITTSPVVRVWGIKNATPSGNSFANDGTVHCAKLDGGAITLTLTATEVIDAHATPKAFSKWYPLDTDSAYPRPIDLLGYEYFGVAVTTAAVIGSGVCLIEANII